MKKIAAFFIGASLFVGLCAPSLWSQATWGTITGYVKDPSGAVIPGVTVTATEQSTGVTSKVVTDSSGLYIITHLNPGTYTIAAQSKGFKRFVQENITLQVDSTARVDCKLILGAVAQSISVTSAPLLLKSEKTDVSRNISEREVQALPLMGHNLTKLFDIVPGAVENYLQIGEGEEPSGGVSVTVNGMWFGANEYLIDGITDTACCFSNQIVFVPNQDSIAEVKMSADNYDPSFGNTAGLVAQFITKSGTNHLHGSVWWSNINSATFAANPFTEKIPGTGPEGKGTGPSFYNQNQGAFSIGGPIRKNKMFIFGDYQFLRRVETNTLTASVPTLAWRNGDFSSLAATNPIFDPATGSSDGTGRTQFPKNIIPLDRRNQTSVNLLNLLPLPNIPGVASSSDPYDLNYLATGPTKFKTDQFDVRYDWNVSDSNKFFVRNTYMQSYLNTPGAFGVVAGGPPLGGLAAEVVPTHNDQVATAFTHIFTPNLVTVFRGGLLRWHLQGYTPDANLDTSTKVGLPGLNLGGKITGGLAGLVIDGPVGAFEEGPGPNNVALPRLDIINIWEGVNAWTWMHGRHEIEWGTDIRRNMEDLFTINAHTSGFFDFNQLMTASPSVPGSGLGAASFLLGNPDIFERGVYNFIPHERQWRDAIYGGDTWRVTPKLTFNYGVRWDYFGPDETPLKGGLANFDPSTGDVLLANVGGVSSTANVDGYHKAFSPRIGIAYRLMNNTVVRAGFGRSYFATNYSSTFQALSIVYPIAPTQSVVSSNIYEPVFSLGQAPPSPPPFELPSSGRLQVPNGASTYYNPPYTPTEHVDQWNLTVQRRIGQNMTVQVGYVGSKGTNIAWDPNINAANIGSGSILSRRPYYQLYGLSQGIGSRNNGGNSNFNSLQIQVKKRFSHGYSFTSNLVWSKAMDTEIAGFAWGDQGANPYDREGSYGIGTNQDRALVWTLSHNWHLPYGPGMRWGSNVKGIKKALLGGWQFNGITTVTDGFALSPTMANSSTLNADWGQRPDRIPGVSLYPAHQTTAEWFNPAAFEAPQFPGQTVQCCRWGNAARGSFRGPGMLGTDYALWKQFTFKTPLNEDTQLQFRWENYNAFNSAPLGEPDTNVDDSLAGQITGLQGTYLKANSTAMRRMEFTLKLLF